MNGSLGTDDRKFIRLIIRQVHPDLFVNNPYERQQNSESLKHLNSYVDELSKGRSPRSTRLEFFVRDGPQLRQVEAQLGSSGSLAPLFYAFGFITAEELRATSSNQIPNDILGWLRDQVQDAVRTAEKHDVLKWHIRRLRSGLEERFKLADVQVGAEYAVSLAEQERQVEALKVLESGMQAATALVGTAEHFEGITVQLYHPDACPQETYSYVDDLGNFHMRTSYMKSYIGDDGAVHLVADRGTIKEQLLSIDLERARLLTQVSFFWLKRVRDLTPAITQLLGVRSVWCDTKSEQNSQKFVLWAGYLLERRDDIQARLQGRKYAFSIIVHSDASGPLLNYHQSSPILNVRADCPPGHLLEFLASEGGEQASLAANEVHNARAKEEALLERVRQTFEAKCVIKICMNDKVIEGAMRLLDNADTIKQAVDLKGACIALDDCYEVWDSGFISIPYNFKIQELSSMVKMLQSGQRPGEAAPTTASTSNDASTSDSASAANGAPSSTASSNGNNANGTPSPVGSTNGSAATAANGPTATSDAKTVSTHTGSGQGTAADKERGAAASNGGAAAGSNGSNGSARAGGSTPAASRTGGIGFGGKGGREKGRKGNSRSRSKSHDGGGGHGAAASSSRQPVTAASCVRPLYPQPQAGSSMLRRTSSHLQHVARPSWQGQLPPVPRPMSVSMRASPPLTSLCVLK